MPAGTGTAFTASLHSGFEKCAAGALTTFGGGGPDNTHWLSPCLVASFGGYAVLAVVNAQYSASETLPAGTGLASKAHMAFITMDASDHQN
jgi:hypothetical protein